MTSAADDNTLKVWDIKRGENLRTLTGHSDSVFAVAITTDNQYAISASRDNTLKVWDIKRGKLITTFTGDSNIQSCAVASDGVTIVAGEVLGRMHFLRLEGLG